MRDPEIKYRPNVAAVLRKPAGQVLVCERIAMPDSWQFPQGGIQKRETPQEALTRELWEEVSVKRDDFTILDQCGPLRYIWEDGKMKKGFRGNEQTYFLCAFTGAADSIAIETARPEFQAFKWIAPKDFEVAWLPAMKLPIYRAVFAQFFQIDI